MCILTSLELFPPSLDRSCTKTTFAPLRAAANAAHTPAGPPPATRTSQSRSTNVMCGSPSNRLAASFGSIGAIARNPSRIASGAFASAGVAPSAAPPSARTRTEYVVRPAAAKKSRRLGRSVFSFMTLAPGRGRANRISSRGHPSDAL